MKQFNLEQYLRMKKEGKEPCIITRDGRIARIICTDKKGSQPVVAVILHTTDEEYSYSFTADGRVVKTQESNVDLFFASTKCKGWINIYKFSESSCGCIYNTEERARECGMKCDNYIATIPIEWEE